MKLVCQHSCKLHKNPWNPKCLPHFEPFRQPREFPWHTLPHGQKGGWVPLPLGTCGLAPMRSQVQEFCLVGAVFTQQLLTHSCFLPYRNLMLDRRWGGGREQEKQRKRSRGGEGSLFLQMAESTRKRIRVAYFWGREDWVGHQDCFWIPNQQGTFIDLLLGSSWDFTLQCWDAFLSSFVYLRY